MGSPFPARSCNAGRGASLQRFRVDFESNLSTVAKLDLAGTPIGDAAVAAAALIQRPKRTKKVGQFPLRKGVRLIGVSLSSLCADAADIDPQMALAL